ncbi:MAG: hypothetical protein AAGF10_06050, partial [Verrucomicrobiota bacterium]
ELGQPQGIVQLTNGAMYLYEAGEVRVENGVVTSVKLKTPDELEQERAMRAVQAQQHAEHQEKLAADRIERGKRLKASKLTDPDFLRLDSGQQLDFWQDFQARYPEVTVTEITVPLAERFNREQEALATVENVIKTKDTEIAELKRQLQVAQTRIEEAYNQIQLLESRPTSTFNVGTYVPYPYPYPRSQIVVVNPGGGHHKK